MTDAKQTILSVVKLRYSIGMKFRLHRSALPPVLMVMALSACATRPADDNFPSLGKRPQESAPLPGSGATSTQAVSAPADPALLQQLRDVNTQIANGEVAFRKTLPQAQAAMAAARGSAPASEAWVQAAMLLAALEFDRGPSQIGLAELDRLLVDRSTASPATPQGGGLSEIDTLWARANATVAEQTRLIEALKVQLPPA